MLWAVIMAGGSGTRFWPESRRKNPKQFLTLFGKKTLLEQTASRLKPAIPRNRTLVFTQEENIARVSKLIGIPRSQVIGEPVGRNTAPCAALAASLVLKKDPRAVLAILPSDHHIGKPALFRKALMAASQVSTEQGLPVTFGIKPSFAHTGYGYLELDHLIAKKNRFSIHRLKRFHEKPSQTRAQIFFKSKRFLWNSGMFVWCADDLLEAARTYLPEVHQLLKKIMEFPLAKGLKRYYPSMPNISIDYGLMEKLQKGILAMPINMDWSDLGGWLSFEKFWPRDKFRNVLKGKAIILDSSNNIIKTDRRLIALVGVKDLVVVDTEDALLLCSRRQSEAVRELVRQLEKEKLKQYL